MAESLEWRRFDAYLFDIDGTLVNARGGVHYNAFHTALRQVFGCEGRIDGVPVHGNTDIGILRAALNQHGMMPSDFEAKLPAAKQLMCAEVEENAERMNVQLCPSIAELLTELQADGKLLGVVTGNLESIGWRKLEQAGLRQFFEFGCFSDHHEKREEIFRAALIKAQQLHGPEAKICFVGDTPDDIRAAAHLEMPVIAVATGIYSVQQLQQYAPTLCISCCTDLLSLSKGVTPGDTPLSSDLQFRN